MDNYKLQLKQLLELGVSDEIELEEPTDDEAGILRLLPSKEEVYANALESMPEIKAGLNVQAADLGIRQAKSAYFPTLSATAGPTDSTFSGTNSSFGSQLEKNFNESIGLSLQIPIFQDREGKEGAVNKAKIEADNSRLEQLSTEKALLKEVEDTYLRRSSPSPRYLRQGTSTLRRTKLRTHGRAVQRRNEEHRGVDHRAKQPSQRPRPAPPIKMSTALMNNALLGHLPRKS